MMENFKKYIENQWIKNISDILQISPQPQPMLESLWNVRLKFDKDMFTNMHTQGKNAHAHDETCASTCECTDLFVASSLLPSHLKF